MDRFCIGLVVVGLGATFVLCLGVVAAYCALVGALS